MSECSEFGCDLEKKNLIPKGFQGFGAAGHAQYFECKLCGSKWIRFKNEEGKISWLHADNEMTSAMMKLFVGGKK